MKSLTVQDTIRNLTVAGGCGNFVDLYEESVGTMDVPFDMMRMVLRCSGFGEFPRVIEINLFVDLSIDTSFLVEVVSIDVGNV